MIIGSGISGLVAAQSLRHFGCRVVVFEALDRPGGRTYTISSGSFAGLEEGAHWVHAGVDNLPSSRLLSLAGVRQVSVGGDDVWEGSRDLFKLFPEQSQAPLSDEQRDSTFDLYLAASDAVRQYVHGICGGNARCDLSVAEAWQGALRGMNYTPANRLSLDFHQRLQYELNDGTSMANLSAAASFEGDYTDFYPESSRAGWEKHGDGFVDGGYSAVIRQLVRGLDVRLGSPVDVIKHSATGVAVRLPGGQWLEGAAAVVTASVGALQSGAIKFEPALPEQKEAALHRLGMGHVAKVLVKLRAGVDESRLGPYATGWITAAEQILTVCFRAGFERRAARVLVCYAGGDMAVIAEGLSKEALRQRADRELSAILGLGAVEEVAVSSWHANPYFRGSWSYIPPGATSADMDTLAAPTGSNLHFAGEGACQLLFGTVHAAAVSGARAAHEILGPALANASGVLDSWPLFADGVFRLCTEAPGQTEAHPTSLRRTLRKSGVSKRLARRRILGVEVSVSTRVSAARGAH